MRKIDKYPPIQTFVDFVRNNTPITWKDCESSVKRATTEFILLEEQFLLCGYTEIYIDSTDCHIDHYIKRDLDNRLCFDWNNLIVAVNDDDYGAKHKDGKSGIKNLIEYSLIFNPVIDRTQDFFRYTTDGKIHPAENLNQVNFNKAEKTILIFNLNHNSLKSRRQGVISMIQLLKDGGRTNEDLFVDLESIGFKSMFEYVIPKYFNTD